MKYQTRIYLVAGGFIIIAAAMFLSVFGRLYQRNRRLSLAVATQRQTLAQIQAEQRSFEQGKADLESLKTRAVQPEDLFSRDTKVVKEIKTLEALSQDNSVQMLLAISGTAKDAKKVKSSNQILSVPYTMTLIGQFDKVLGFIDSMEHLAFITPVKTMAIAAQEEGGVKATITADFYIKQ